MGGVLALVLFHLSFLIVGIIGGVVVALICAALSRSAFEAVDVESKPVIMSFAFLAGLFAAYIFLGSMICLAVNAEAREVKATMPQGEIETLVDTKTEDSENEQSASEDASEENVQEAIDERSEEEKIREMRESFSKLPAKERYLIELSVRIHSGKGISVKTALTRPAWVYHTTVNYVTFEGTQKAWIFFLIVCGIIILCSTLIAKDPAPGQAALVHATGPAQGINPGMKP